MNVKFEREFITKYSDVEFKGVISAIELFLEDSKLKIFYRNNWTILQSVEKINALQYTHFITLSKESIGKDDEEVNLEYENGINNGTVLREYSLDGSGGKENLTRTERILKDIEIDWEQINPNANKKLVELVFNYDKNKILKLYNNQNYDDYVTGGGTNSTDRYYKEELEKFHNKGLFWNLIYEEVEVDRRFV